MIQSYFYKDHLTSSRQNYKAFRGGLGLGESLRDVLHKKHEFHSIKEHSWTYLYQTNLTNRDRRDINCKSAIVLLLQNAFSSFDVDTNNYHVLFSFALHFVKYDSK